MVEEQNLQWFQKKVVALVSLITSVITLSVWIVTMMWYGQMAVETKKDLDHFQKCVIGILTDNAESMDELTEIIKILQDDEEDDSE